MHNASPHQPSQVEALGCGQTAESPNVLRSQSDFMPTLLHRISAILFQLFCALTGTTIVLGPAHWGLFAPAVLVLALQCIIENLRPKFVIFRSGAVSDEDDKVFANIVAPLASKGRLLWLYHHAQNPGRYLYVPLSSVLRLGTQVALLGGTWVGLGKPIDRNALLIILLASVMAQEIDETLRYHPGQRRMTLLWALLFSIAAWLSSPGFSWAYGRALFAGWLTGVVLKSGIDFLLERQRSAGAGMENPVWRVVKLREASDLQALRRSLCFSWPVGRQITCLPLLLHDIWFTVPQSAPPASPSWQDAVSLLLNASAKAIIEVSSITRSPGVTWELHECRARQKPAILAFDVKMWPHVQAGLKEVLGRSFESSELGHIVTLARWRICLVPILYDGSSLTMANATARMLRKAINQL